MGVIRCERVCLAELRGESGFGRLLLDYHEEIGEGGPPDPDWSRMSALEARGDMVFVAAIARVIDRAVLTIGDELVGFSACRLFAPLAYRKARIGWVEYIYLDPPYRAEGGGKLLIAATESAMRAAGAKSVAIHDAAENPHRYDAIGYRMTMRVWVKDLPDVPVAGRAE